MTAPQSSKEKILKAITDLKATGRTATRLAIAAEAQLKPSTVDDQIKRMKDDGLLWTPTRGVFDFVEQHAEDRAVSVTHLPDGSCKLEIGEFVVDLTLREGRMVATAMGGIALLFGRQ